MKSALAPPPFRPGRALPLSLCIHGGMLAVLALFGSQGPKAATLIRPDEVMQVSLVSLPKQTTRLPQKVMQRADLPPSQPAEPAPPDAPSATDMALEKERPKEPAVEKPDRSAAREKLLREMRRQQALESLAAEGPRDQPQTDPDGEEGPPGSTRGVAGDPRLAAYQEQVRQAAMAHFSALQTEALTAVIQVTIDARGNILNSGLAQSSGDPSFDAAARTAIRRTGRVPAPPAELMPGPTATFFIRLSNSE